MPVDKLREVVGSVAKNKWSSIVEYSIQQLELLCSHAVALGCNVSVVVFDVTDTCVAIFVVIKCMLWISIVFFNDY